MALGNYTNAMKCYEEQLERSRELMDQQLEAQASPLGRRLLPDEIATVVAFVASDAAQGINGQLINVCGGTVMS